MNEITASDISKILLNLLVKNNLTESELSRSTNLPRATINRIASGRTPDPRASTLKTLAEFFDISIEQLLGDEPINETERKQTQAKNAKAIPILAINKASTWYDERKHINELTETVSVNECYSDNTFAITLSGEAMWPQFIEGTILIIDPTKLPENDDYVAAHIKKTNSTIFRKFNIAENGESILSAINPDYPTTTLCSEDKIIGIIIESRFNITYSKD